MIQSWTETGTDPRDLCTILLTTRLKPALDGINARNIGGHVFFLRLSVECLAFALLLTLYRRSNPLPLHSTELTLVHHHLSSVSEAIPSLLSFFFSKGLGAQATSADILTQLLLYSNHNEPRFSTTSKPKCVNLKPSSYQPPITNNEHSPAKSR
ncbi:hypothetical protein B0H34DRAFT_508456 [Crassisporium funariophilum]|nr:hypothetical protein B0H34DRAFT_508456 [Crassisporium funariophilum]